MKTIAVFGATGRTGLPFIELALEKGYKVKALVRNVSRLPIAASGLEVVQGDMLDPEKVEATIRGAEVVVSLIGHVKGSPPDLQTTGTQHMLQSMEKNGVRRLISLTGGGVRNPERDKPGFMDKAIVFIMKNLAGQGARTALLDGISHAQLIRQSGLDWTIVRGPMLTDDPAKGSFQVGDVGKVKGFKLTRSDLATFILSTIENNSHIKQMPFVVN